MYLMGNTASQQKGCWFNPGLGPFCVKFACSPCACVDSLSCVLRLSLTGQTHSNKVNRELKFVWRSLGRSMWPWMGKLPIVSPCFCPATAEMGSSRTAVNLSAVGVSRYISWMDGWMDGIVIDAVLPLQISKLQIKKYCTCNYICLKH